MNVVVCIKQVPDTETKIQLSGDGISTQGVKWVMNPYDEIAVEEALKFKAANPTATVHVVTCGPKSRAAEALRTALAMGVDEAILIDAAETTDNFQSAKALAGAIKQIPEVKILFTGKLAIDDNASAVTQILAENLGWSHVTGASKLEYTADSATAEREIEGGAREIIQVKLPAAIGANKGLNTPRYANLQGIMKAKKKVIKELTLDALGVVATDQKLQYSNFQLPPERAAVKLLSGDAASQTAQLAKLLREEAKVI